MKKIVATADQIRAKIADPKFNFKAFIYVIGLLRYELSYDGLKLEWGQWDWLNGFSGHDEFNLAGIRSMKSLKNLRFRFFYPGRNIRMQAFDHGLFLTNSLTTRSRKMLFKDDCVQFKDLHPNLQDVLADAYFHQSIIEIAIIFLKMEPSLPPYVILHIIDLLPEMYYLRDVVKIGKIIKVQKSIDALSPQNLLKYSNFVKIDG